MPEFIQERKSSDGKHTTYKVCIPYYENNKRKYYTESFSSKKYCSKKIALDLAKECRDKMRKQLNVDGIITTSYTYTPLQVLELSFETFPISFETKRKHLLLFNKYISPYVKDDFSKIKANDIQKSLNAMTDSSNDTINRVLSIWKRLYRTALFNDIVAQDLTIKVFTPKSNKPLLKRSVTTSKEYLYSVCEQIKHHVRGNDSKLVIAALNIMYYTGMRPSEVYALEKKNIDRNNKLITICQAIGSTQRANHTIIQTKTTNSTRIIPYPDELEHIFDELWSQEYLFMRDNGKFLNGNFVGNILRRLTNGELRTYMLRHQFSTDMIKSNVDIRTIQELMGHTSSSMTLEYARSDQESMAKALDKRKLLP